MLKYLTHVLVLGLLIVSFFSCSDGDPFDDPVIDRELGDVEGLHAVEFPTPSNGTWTYLNPENNRKFTLRIEDTRFVDGFVYRKLNSINNIKIDDLELPLESSKVLFNKQTRILWSAPRTWLVISFKEDIVKKIKEKCSAENFAITNISHSRAVIQIKGFQAREVLKKGCPINLNEFKKGNCAGTVFNGIAIIIDLIDNSPDTFNLLTLRSFGQSFYHHITDACLEFGYIGL